MEENLIIDEVFWQKRLIITEVERMQREPVIKEEQRLMDNDNTEDLVAEKQLRWLARVKSRLED